jgi:hypothetical protein
MREVQVSVQQRTFLILNIPIPWRTMRRTDQKGKMQRTDLFTQNGLSVHLLMNAKISGIEILMSSLNIPSVLILLQFGFKADQLI